MDGIVIAIEDIDELETVVFRRLGRVADEYKPTNASKQRLARLISALHEAGNIRVFQKGDNPHYIYYVL